jgi:hypothetical protein
MEDINKTIIILEYIRAHFEDFEISIKTKIDESIKIKQITLENPNKQ